MTNKALVRQAQEILKNQGYLVQTGHLYELFSKLAGYKDHNTAKASGTVFVEKIVAEDVEIEGSNFEVKIATEHQRKCVKYYKIPANDVDEAEAIMQQYVGVRLGHISTENLTETTKQLLEKETQDNFLLHDWLVVDQAEEIDIEYVIADRSQNGIRINLNSFQLGLLLDLLHQLDEHLGAEEKNEGTKFDRAKEAFILISARKTVTKQALQGLLDTIGGVYCAANLAEKDHGVKNATDSFVPLMTIAQEIERQMNQ